MNEILQSFSSTLGISFEILKIIFFICTYIGLWVGVILFSRSVILGFILGLPVVFIAYFMGFIPLWLGVSIGFANVSYLGYIFWFGGEFKVPNQLIQKRKKENKNLCVTCTKQGTCEDYKRIKYIDICGEYSARKLCQTCCNKDSCKFAFSTNFQLECASYNVAESKSSCDMIDDLFIDKPQILEVKLTIKPDLISELKSLNFEKGIKTYEKLKAEYDSTLKIFVESSNVNTSLIDVEKVQKITKEIYGKGIKFLTLACEIYEQLSVTSYEDLKKETEELQESLNEVHNPDSAVYKTLKEAIEKNQKNLDLMKKNKDRISELFGQISLCKDAIMETRLGLPELLHHQSSDDVDKLRLESKDRISFGQRLLDEYKKQGL